MTVVTEQLPEAPTTTVSLFEAVHAAKFALLTVGCEAAERYISGQQTVPPEDDPDYKAAELRVAQLNARLMAEILPRQDSLE